MKSHTRLLTSILIISAIANTVGCSKNYGKENIISSSDNLELQQDGEMETFSNTRYEDKIINIKDNNEYNENIDYGDLNLVPNYTEENLDYNKNSNIEGILRDNLYDENIDYNLIIQTYIDNYDLREEYKNEYLKAIYMLFLNSKVAMNEYLKELHTMVVMQQIPMCVPDDIWNEQFKNLIAIDPNCISLFDKYCDFAIYVHSLECEEEHKLNEYYCYTCPKLEEEYTRKLEKDI